MKQFDEYVRSGTVMKHYSNVSIYIMFSFIKIKKNNELFYT